MESKLRIAVLCFLGLFVSVQGLLLERDLAKYEKCWRYANCVSDGKINECIKKLRPEETKALYQTMQDHYKYKSKNLSHAIEEYCESDDAKKPDIYAKTLSGAIAYEKRACVGESKNGTCTRIIEKLVSWMVGAVKS